MRFALISLVICFGLLAGALEPAASQPMDQPSKEVDSSLSGQSDAAEKHARRTACLKDAKSKKLVGVQKTAYVKDCMGANGPSQSTASTSP
jgi:hypothetical protein